MRLVDADRIVNFQIKCSDGNDYILLPIKSLSEIPTYEPKHGHWMLLDECSNAGVYCSVCCKKVYRTDYANQKIKSKYCPNCGSIMDEEFERL